MRGRSRGGALTRILLTGFGSFPGAPFNPTRAIVRVLSRRNRPALQRAGIDLRVAILPVVYDAIEAALEDHIERNVPDIIVLLGLAAQRTSVSVETRAQNRLSIIHPDADGSLARRREVTPGHAPAMAARWPAAQLANAIRAVGVRARLSRDAGDYLCNQALYLALQKHHGLCGFIHVPLLRRKLPLCHNCFSGDVANHDLPTFAEVETAVARVLRHLAVEHRRVSGRK